MAPTISVVVASYGCATTLRGLVGQVEATVGEALAEIVIVDDRSPDGSWKVARALSENHSLVRAVRLSRNFGQHAAISAGIERTSGDIVVLMDCDLQDPPEAIPRLTAALADGADVAIARRTGTYDARSRRLWANAYTRTLRRISPLRIPPDAGTFSAISRKVADAFCQLEDLDRHYLHLLDWLGFDWVYINVERQARTSGSSSYSFRRRIGHALSGVAFYGREILRALVVIGAVTLLVGIATAATFVVLKLTVGLADGWTSLFVALLVLGGLNLSAVGVVGLYVGRVYEQSAKRPLFVIDEDTGPVNQSAQPYP